MKKIKAITNEQRAAWAETARQAYCRRVDADLRPGAAGDFEASAIALLCDLFHLIEQRGLEPLDLIEAAHTHYHIELGLTQDPASF